MTLLIATGQVSSLAQLLEVHPEALRTVLDATPRNTRDLLRELERVTGLPLPSTQRTRAPAAQWCRRRADELATRVWVTDAPHDPLHWVRRG